MSTRLTLYDAETALRVAFERMSDVLEAQDNTQDAALNDELQVAERSLVTEVERALVTAVEKRDALAWFVRKGNTDVQTLRDEAKRIQGIADRMTNHLERLFGYVKQVMEANHIEALEGHTARFKLVQNPPSVEVGAPSALPVECLRIVPEQRVPNKVEIARRLKAGQDVPGARMVPGGKRLALTDRRAS
jgi:hypothetical protein